MIEQHWISLIDFDILLQQKNLELSPEINDKITQCREFLNSKTNDTANKIYGVNTGFGSLCNTIISKEDLGKLQHNLMLSHACGTGEEVPNEIVKRMLLLKILGLSKGNSGTHINTVERLLYFFNNDIYPVVYQQGSLGASGDLAPLAHLCLPLINEGKVVYQNQKIYSKDLNQKLNLKILQLQSKEGLALLNGTQFMSAYFSYAVTKSIEIFEQYNYISSLSLEAYDGRIEPFQENVNTIRNQEGQIKVASQIRKIIEGSELIQRKKEHVQDPYSFRCIPQVHGATFDVINYSKNILEREINAVTDNPTIFPDEDQVVSAGNFHGQPLAMTMDFLAIAMAELASISERRIYKLISGTRDLPPFLAKNPGLNSGFMIPQYTAASIVSQNKQLCTPASIDSIDSSNGQEDHVSMGANAATKLYRIIQNVYTIQAIELMTAAQAFEFRRPLKSSPLLEKLYSEYRKKVAFVENDVFLGENIEKSIYFVKNDLWKIVKK
ncbi:MAG: histidine ammonia-lyase [Flavobacteriia bacterium]|nr:histidine ammonia-lyase [Flavobacteriia bacterium]